MNEKKVYAIFEKNLESGSSSVYGIYEKKEKAKQVVDQLNSVHTDEDDEIDYVLTSYDLL